MNDFEKEVASLLEQAMKQPGVAEIMEIHAAQAPTISTYASIESAVAPRWITSSSSTSATA